MIRLFTLAFLALTCMASQAKLDHSLWTQVLTRFENEHARIDYRLLKSQGSPELQKYLAQIAAPWPEKMTQAERKAALINAYNSLTVNWIVRNYPVKSIWQTTHPFTDARHAVDGGKRSLDRIETELRGMGDPRIHAALVCASISCPPLRREAYLPETLDRQLDGSVRTWLATPSLNYFDPRARKAAISMIFNWYQGDFEKNGATVPQFLARFAPSSDAAFLRDPNFKPEFQEYNWGLNDQSGLGAKYTKLMFDVDYLRDKL